MSGDSFENRHEEMIGVLKRTDERLKALVQQTMERVLTGSADRQAMELAYAALRGEAGASEGLDALRSALRADGLDDESISHIETLYLNVLVGA